MAFTAEAIIANIEERLGDSGRHVWDYYKLAAGTPWCVGEVSYTFAKTGNKSAWYGGRPVFYVPHAQEWMAKHWYTVYDYRASGNLGKVRKGDVVIFMWTRGSRDHIGFARSAGESDKLYTIEGNTSGGKVAERTRAKKHIYAVYRPPYGAAKKTVRNPKPAAQTYKAGNTYTVKVDCLNVRTGPGTGFAKKSRSQLTADGKKHANGAGQLMKGTRVTCQNVKKNGNDVWIHIPSGWICAVWNGKTYVG